MRGVSDPTSYRAAYARLSQIAAELESGEADLDRVLPLLEEAKEAYAACKDRIEAVRAVLSGEWGSAEAEPDNAPDEEPDGDEAPQPDAAGDF